MLGIVGVSVGGAAALIGGVFLGLFASFCGGSGCDEPVAGFASMTAIGSAVLILGVVGIYTGGQKISRDKKKDSAFVPRVMVGPGAASLTWDF